MKSGIIALILIVFAWSGCEMANGRKPTADGILSISIFFGVVIALAWSRDK